MPNMNYINWYYPHAEREDEENLNEPVIDAGYLAASRTMQDDVILWSTKLWCNLVSIGSISPMTDCTVASNAYITTLNL